jgi:hypothetical protein
MGRSLERRAAHGTWAALFHAAALLACTPVPATQDEAGVTTSPSGSGEELDEADTDASTSANPSTSTSDTSTTNDTSTTTTEDESGGFVPHTEFGGESCQCDTWAQDCPEGEKCVPYAMDDDGWDCSKCVPVLGEQAAGEACSYDGPVEGTDDCDASSWCFTNEGEGTCYAFCEGTPDDPECPDGLRCWVSNYGNINVCVPACDPFLQDCEPGTGCYWSGDIFGCIFVAAEGYDGEPCEGINGCSGGWVCADAAVPGCEGTCCTPFCDLKLGDEYCPDGTGCISLFDAGEIPAGYEDVGICMQPP